VDLNTYFFETAEIVLMKKVARYDKDILNILTRLFKQKGYIGTYISKIHVSFDHIESLRNGESEYNYLR
jgi:hypothetical protein